MVLPAGSPEAARHLVRIMLTGDRLQHSVAVGRHATQLATTLTDPPDRAAVITAALLHDIGYSPLIATTGWHPLDGARWLRQHGWSPTICRLVLWHTASWHEGRLRGLFDTATGEFGPPKPTNLLAAIISAVDLTTGPAGQPTTINRRLVDIRHRYPPDSLVIQALELAESDMRRLHTRGTPRYPRTDHRPSPIQHHRHTEPVPGRSMTPARRWHHTHWRSPTLVAVDGNDKPGRGTLTPLVFMIGGLIGIAVLVITALPR